MINPTVEGGKWSLIVFGNGRYIMKSEEMQNNLSFDEKNEV